MERLAAGELSREITPHYETDLWSGFACMRHCGTSEALRSFAKEHDLPAPTIANDAYGHHTFVYSRDNTRRYAYSLTWAADKPHVLWIMLNPGTGEAERRRRNTFERCRRWSQSMGYGGLLFGNIFALRTKSAQALFRHPLPPDKLNERALAFLSNLAPDTIVAWGGHGADSDRPTQLQCLLSNAQCLGYTKSGQPRHPLYVRNSAPLMPWPSKQP